MKVLFANPAFRVPVDEVLERYFFLAGGRAPWSIIKNRSEPPRYSTFPFFLAYAAAVLEQRSFDVVAIDGVPLNLTDEEFEQRAVATAPDVIVLEPATVAIDRYLQVCARLKRLTGAKIVLAGPHVTHHGRELMSGNPQIDYVLVGEYEIVLADLLSGLRGNDPSTDLRCIHRDANGGVQGGSRAAEIDPLDQLPPPARHLFPAYFNNDQGLYHDGFCQGRPAVQLHASRGCPFRCDFCSWIQLMFDNGKHRCFSAPRIVDEMVDARDRFGAREIYFDDDNFTANKEHVHAICREIRSRGLDLSWSVMGDAMITDGPMLEAMAEAGCVGMKFGLESASSDVLRAIRKPVDIQRIPGLVAKAQSLGMKTHATVAFGLSGETRQSLNETFDFVCKLDVDSVQFSIATPYPGTRFHDSLVAEHRLSVSSWEDYDAGNSSVVRYADFPREELQEFEATAWGRWLRYKLKQPKWVMRQAGLALRLLRGQGWSGLRRRLARGLHLLSEAELRNFKYRQRHPIRR